MALYYACRSFLHPDAAHARARLKLYHSIAQAMPGLGLTCKTILDGSDLMSECPRRPTQEQSCPCSHHQMRTLQQVRNGLLLNRAGNFPFQRHSGLCELPTYTKCLEIFCSSALLSRQLPHSCPSDLQDANDWATALSNRFLARGKKGTLKWRRSNRTRVADANCRVKRRRLAMSVLSYCGCFDQGC